MTRRRAPSPSRRRRAVSSTARRFEERAARVKACLLKQSVHLMMQYNLMMLQQRQLLNVFRVDCSHLLSATSTCVRCIVTMFSIDSIFTATSTTDVAQNRFSEPLRQHRLRVLMIPVHKERRRAV